MTDIKTGRAVFRKKTRELLIRLIFQMTSTGDFSDCAKTAFLADTSLFIGDVHEDMPLGCIFDEAAGEGPDMPYLDLAFCCVRDNLSKIDAVISGSSEKWDIGRMSTVDLSILRVAIAELLYMEGIDEGVSINEAVIMAKKYGTEKSSAFINGILGAVARMGAAEGGDGP
ncbi:MAG: transcription antitermination factor NusB [Clostridiales bacterium]|nr:transcription antitermination factor NusB [Clostridiales bacterium]